MFLSSVKFKRVNLQLIPLSERITLELFCEFLAWWVTIMILDLYPSPYRSWAGDDSLLGLMGLVLITYGLLGVWQEQHTILWVSGRGTLLDTHAF